MNVVDIGPLTFCKQPIRNGDLIAVINVLQYLRNKVMDQKLKFYMSPELIHGDKLYHQTFFEYIKKTTNFFSDEPGGIILPYENIMIWDFRDNIGDLVMIPNSKPLENKICIFPLFDAEYHEVRNFPAYLFQAMLDFGVQSYPDFEKIICVQEGILPEGVFNYHNFKISTDFITNIEHIRTCRVFVGGDTGTTHYASALNRGPQELQYFYSSREMIHTLPFHFRAGKGNLNTFSTFYDMSLF